MFKYLHQLFTYTLSEIKFALSSSVRGNVSEKSLCASSEQKWYLNICQATPRILEVSMHHIYRRENLNSHAFPKFVQEEKYF